MGQVCLRELGLQAVLLELWCLLRWIMVCRSQVLVREPWLLGEGDQEMRLSRLQMEDFAKHFNYATQHINKIARAIQGLLSAPWLSSGLRLVPRQRPGWRDTGAEVPPRHRQRAAGSAPGESGAGAVRGRRARAAHSGRCGGGAGAGAEAGAVPARPVWARRRVGGRQRGAGPGGARCARGSLVAADSPRPPSPPQPEGRWGEREVFGRGAQRSPGLTAGPARRLTPCCGCFPVPEERRRGGRGRRRRDR